MVVVLLGLSELWATNRVPLRCGEIPPYLPENESVRLEELPPLKMPASLAAPQTFWQSRTTQLGFGLVGAGVILSAADIQTRELRTDYLPTFRYRYDDYLQFAPAVLAYGLRLCGVEGRSSWERMMLSSGLSTGLMLSTVYVVKYGIGRLRPDGSTHNSFPSGHTAMAFTAATILHKEYGVTHSPWWSVAGYTMATVTGISRALNNRHWLSDVVVGAGVGILSTELGYLLTDRFLRSRGVVVPTDEWEPVRMGSNPSFVGIGIGHNALIYDTDRYERFSPSGIGFSVEGAWFFTPKLGVGGEFRVGRYASIVERDRLEGAVLRSTKPLNNASLMAGLYYNHPLGERLHLGAKTLVGVGRNHRQTNHLLDEEGSVVANISHDNKEHLTATTGLSLRYVVADYLGVRLYADYNYVRTDFTLSAAESGPQPNRPPLYISGYQNPLTFGIAIDALLW